MSLQRPSTVPPKKPVAGPVRPPRPPEPEPEDDIEDEEMKYATRPRKRWLLRASKLASDVQVRIRPIYMGKRTSDGIPAILHTRQTIYIAKERLGPRSERGQAITCRPDQTAAILALTLPSGYRIGQVVDEPADYWRMPVAMWLPDETVDPIIFEFSQGVYRELWQHFDASKFGTAAPGTKPKDYSFHGSDRQGRDFLILPYKQGDQKGNRYTTTICDKEDTLPIGGELADELLASVPMLRKNWDLYVQSYEEVVEWIESIGGSADQPASRKKYADGGAEEGDAEKTGYDPYNDD